MTARYVVVDLSSDDQLSRYATDDLDEASGMLATAEEALDESYLEELDDDERDNAVPPFCDLGLLDTKTGYVAVLADGPGVWRYLDAFSGKWRVVLEVAS